MRLDFSAIFDLVGGSLSAEEDVDLGHVKLWGRHPFQAPVRVEAKARNEAGVVTLTLSSRFELEMICDRCLRRFQQAFSPSFEHTVVQRIYGEDDGSLVAAGDGVVDVSELFAADIQLDMPSKVLCREDCLGLCPQCGHDLNEGDCGCDRREPDIRLSVLDSFTS